jgi:hypothetical protein
MASDSPWLVAIFAAGREKERKEERKRKREREREFSLLVRNI